MKTLKWSVSLLLCTVLALSLQVGATAVKAKAADTVYLGGMPFGVRVFNGKLTVNGFGEVDSAGGTVSPAREAGFSENDIIKKINGKDVSTSLDITGAVLESGGKKMEFTVLRGEKTLTLYVTPVLSESAGEYRIGLWLKDGTAGIGTVTYIIPETGAFGGLGHGICEMSTGKLCDMSRGIVSDVTVSGINRGVSGQPGELKGIFSGEKIGSVTENTERGVFGVFSDADKYASLTKPIETASKDSLKEGDAVIYCTVDGTGVGEYSVKISRGTSKDPAGSFNVEVTDKALIEKTGGIVQGMSGSPVVQNGKLVGAVTHVLISDPKRGYGIYIEDMMSGMPEVMK